MSMSSTSNADSRDPRARSLFIHCGSTDPVTIRGRFWKCHGLDDDTKTVGAAAADVGPDALAPMQAADSERHATAARDRRRQQFEARRAQLAARHAAAVAPVALDGAVLERIAGDEARRRALLAAMALAQWLRVVETGRSAQIAIALGERNVGRALASSVAAVSASTRSATKRQPREQVAHD